MKVIGYKRSDFVTKDGVSVTGLNIYMTYPATGTDAEGVVAERVYVSDAKLAKSGYKPRIGDEVNIMYNRFGKPETISKV